MFLHYVGDLVLSFAQLALSRVTICSSSTFCLWPALAMATSADNSSVHSNFKAYFPHSRLLLDGQTDKYFRQVAPSHFKLIIAPRIISFYARYTTDLPRILSILNKPLDKPVSVL